MKKPSISEKIFLEDIRVLADHLLKTTNNLSIGIQIKMIRKQLRMSQQDLAHRAKIPRTTISRIEQEKVNPSIKTLKAILEAMFCNLLLVCVPQEPLEKITEKRAKQLALKHAEYIRGTMSLEKQEPDNRLIEEFIKHDSNDILNSKKLWQD